MSVTLTRRSALIAAAVVPLSACSTGTAVTEAAPADPDRLIRELASRAERMLLARYRATIETHPGLEPDLSAFIARHERHLDEILATAPPDPPEHPGEAPGQREITTEDIPSARGEAISALQEAEAAHAAARADDSAAGYDYELARVFASVAACESAHEHLLGEIA